MALKNLKTEGNHQSVPSSSKTNPRIFRADLINFVVVVVVVVVFLFPKELMNGAGRGFRF